MIDRTNHHLFQPLLYQVATAALSPADIAQPIRSILARQANTRVPLREVSAVDLEHRWVLFDGGRLPYHYLILATGALHGYFGHDAWEVLAPGLKTMDDALELRRRLLLAFELAERESDPRRRQALLTFVVVGGGATGVELTGAIAEVACKAMHREFRTINPRRAHIILVEAGSRLLPAFPLDLSAAAVRSLERLCVDVRVGAPVTELRPGAVCIGTTLVEASLVMWAAGTEASPLGRSLGVPVDRAGRVIVDSTLAIPGYPQAFAIGDLAAFVQNGRPLAAVAPVAIQQGRHVAETIVRARHGVPALPFHCVDRGSLAAIGRAAAVAQIGKLRFSGRAAWCLWLLLHIIWLIGFRNRAAVVFDWAWAFVTFKRPARLITDPQRSNPVARPSPAARTEAHAAARASRPPAGCGCAASG